MMEAESVTDEDDRTLALNLVFRCLVVAMVCAHLELQRCDR